MSNERTGQRHAAGDEIRVWPRKIGDRIVYELRHKQPGKRPVYLRRYDTREQAEAVGAKYMATPEAERVRPPQFRPVGKPKGYRSPSVLAADQPPRKEKRQDKPRKTRNATVAPAPPPRNKRSNARPPEWYEMMRASVRRVS